MTIELAANGRALTSAEPLDLTDPSVVPDRFTTASVGIDLSILGVDPTIDDEPHAGVERLNFARLASTMNAALSGGLDFISLGKDFLSRSDYRVRDTTLDGAETAARLAEFSAGGVFVEVPPLPKAMRMATDVIAQQTDGWAGLTLPLNDACDFDGIIKASDEARAAGLKVAVIVTNPEGVPERAEIIARIADVVRLRMDDPHAARETRFAIRAAGREFGRKIAVIVEIGIIISASAQSAEERRILLNAINGGDPFEGMATAIGTVFDIADAIESWVGLGAADGVVIAPASLPTDLASVLKGVLPLLEARAVLEK